MQLWPGGRQWVILLWREENRKRTRKPALFAIGSIVANAIRPCADCGRFASAQCENTAPTGKWHRNRACKKSSPRWSGRIARAYPHLADVHGKRILDIACGSNTSRAPASLYVNTPFGEKRIGRATKGYTAQFEPWFCESYSNWEPFGRC